MNNSVFICYAHMDIDFVLKLVTILENCRIPVWIDKGDIPPSADWDQTVDIALQRCAYFLIVLSPSAVASNEARGELHTALDLGKRIIPVLHEPCEIPRQLKLIQYLDFTSAGPDYEANLERLCSWITTGTMPPIPQSKRLMFIDEVRCLPDNARVFDNEFTKTTALLISKKLSDKQFDALHDLRVFSQGDRDIVRDLAIETVGELPWEAVETLNTLERLGFMVLSADPRERNLSDPDYHYSPFYWAYTNLMQHFGIGLLEADQGHVGSEYWLSPEDAPIK